jgi:serine/threonine-protein kinase
MELVGQRFGHIRVTAAVGEGGMGEVYAGYDEKLERKVALKVLHSEARLDDEARVRLLREARALSRLDHPNICRIHDYIDNGDSDLLVLEFIDGRTLDDALREKMAHAEKLRIAISIANVLVAAHRAGIVHRDLKPENVMLTRSGEVKVLDFGLARWLNRGRARDASEHYAAVGRVHAVPPADAVPNDVTSAYPPPLSADENARESMATAVGITMGTPLYMSPEQARGEPLTPASDMFSFGLLLQVLFSGREAHEDTFGAREVILRVARGETNRVEGVRGDVTAVINRLKAFAPTDRPTAVETVERLQRIADKPRRIARRSVAAALLIIAMIAAWRYTVDLQRERAAALSAESRAVVARAEAERRRRQADDLIDFMMGDLHRKLAPIGRLEVLDAAADRAMAYGASLRPELMSAAELARTATALQHVGEVRVGQGKMPEALRAFEQALATARQAVAKDPNNLDARFTLGQTQFYVGETHRRMGNTSGALANMRDYLATSEALARAAPQNLDYQVELAYGYSNIGSLLQSDGDFAGALEQYERAVAVKRIRLRTDPANREWQGDLAQTINKIGSALSRQGRLTEARQRFGEEVAIYRSLVAADPKHAPWKTRLVTGHTFLGRLSTDLGDLASAEQEFAAAEALAGELVAFDPQNVAWRRDLAAVLSNFAIVDRMQGRLNEARSRAERAEILMRDVLREAPENASWQRDAAYVTLRYAAVLRASGARGAAKTRVQSVLTTMPPANKSWKPIAAEAMLLFGQIAADRGEEGAAREAWREIVTLLADASFASGDLTVVDLRARALLLLGREAEAQAIVAELRRAKYGNPDLMRLAHVAADAPSKTRTALPST